jgi:AraC-like DNA-binding protein
MAVVASSGRRGVPDFGLICSGILLEPSARLAESGLAALLAPATSWPEILAAMERIDVVTRNMVYSVASYLSNVMAVCEPHTYDEGDIDTWLEGSGVRRGPAERAARYVAENLSEDLSLGAIANVLHVNRSYLSRRFHEEFGMTLTTFINTLRIERAKAVLRSSPRVSLKELSRSLGFSSQGYFTRVFRSIAGCAPTGYARVR